MIPVQVRAILIAVVLVVGGFLTVRSFLVPESFGQTGHFRYNAIAEVAAQEPHFAGEETCTGCHSGIDEVKIRSAHGSVRCEVCHGAALEHANNPALHLPPRRLLTARECLRCHEKNATRPDDFAQVDPLEHRPGILCIECHNPHDPEVSIL